MKIDELKRIAEENFYVYRGVMGGSYNFIRDIDGALIDISKFKVNDIHFLDIDWCQETDLKMIKAVIEFAETPLEDREEEKKFYLRHKWLECIGNRYLTWDPGDNCCYLDDSAEYYSGKMKFTLNEIEEIKKKFDTDLKDFELVEVEE